LEKVLSESKPVPKLVTVVNPGNPTGTYIPEPLLKVTLSISSKKFPFKFSFYGFV
jgi:histidinol-phosphate/aromatic aminotransferase/cobyric acid decarboxylase-like protein